MRIISDVKPSMTVAKTKARVVDPGITYDEPGVAFDANYIYGGITDYDVSPLLNTPITQRPTLQMGRTEAQLYDQGYTYNEPGISFDQVGVAYGGIYGYDITPLVSMSISIFPHIILAGDFYTPGGGTVSRRGFLIGMLGLTYAR